MGAHAQVMNEMPPKSRVMDLEGDVFNSWAVCFELGPKHALRWDYGRGFIKLDGAEVVQMHEGPRTRTREHPRKGNGDNEGLGGDSRVRGHSLLWWALVLVPHCCRCPPSSTHPTQPASRVGMGGGSALSWVSVWGA